MDAAMRRETARREASERHRARPSAKPLRASTMPDLFDLGWAGDNDADASRSSGSELFSKQRGQQTPIAKRGSLVTFASAASAGGRNIEHPA
jgi:hypothetical protein